MPTENKSSNEQKMVSVPPYIGLEPLVGRYYPAKCRRCGWVGSSSELTEDDAQCTRDVGDRLCLGDCDELELHDLLGIIQAMAGQHLGEPAACAHEWTDDGEFLLVCTKCGTEEDHEPYGWVQTRGPEVNRFTQEWDIVQEWEDQGFEYKAMHEHPASAEPSGPKFKGWTCFHCDEHFADDEAASIHFGTHEIQRPACLIDAEEYRSMEARVRECANEDSELHRQIHRQANEHKLELRRAEESGYAKGLADAKAPVERDELPPFAQKVLKKLRRTQECFEDSQGTDIGRDWLDVLVRLGLLNRVQRSPALWEISDAGDALLEARAALERKP